MPCAAGDMKCIYKILNETVKYFGTIIPKYLYAFL